MNQPKRQAGAELLLEHFHRLGDAPDAVPRLRRFILDLAVRGKLVEQNLKDEPVGSLLKRIATEKSKLVKERKNGASVTVKPISVDVGPHAIPDAWSWVHFGQLMISRDGDRRPVSKEERQTRAKKYDYYGASGIIDKIDGYLFDKPLLLIGEDGANLINRSTPIAFIARGKYWVNNHAHVLDGTTESFLRYIEIFINAIDLKAYVTGTAQPKMNQAKMNSIPVAVPPEAEQHRIVAKVDELMALCDTLEAAQQQREQQRTQLTAATWQAVTEEGTTDATRFALEQLPALTTRPEQVKALRQTILDLAVRGKLVEQDPKDEPASVLLKKIAAEKTRLVKDKVIRKPKEFAPIEPEDLPVHDPLNGWAWTRLGEVSTLITKGSTPTSYGHAYTAEGVSFIKVEAIRNGRLIPANVTSFISDETNEFLSRSRLATGDVLFSIAGSIGTCAIVDEDILPANTNQALAIIRGTNTVFLTACLLKVLQSSVAQVVINKARGAAMNNVSLDDIQNFIVPVPPLAEQGRIVAKVDALMALCDGLEAALREGEGLKGKALEALLRSDDQTIRRSDNGGRAYPEAQVELGMAAEPVVPYGKKK